ncbi:MAG TPA: diacylglycerol kinase family protein [bacterium]
MGISTLIVVNAEARNVRTGLRWARLEADAMRRLAPAELEIVDSPADAEQVAWNAAMAGYGRLVVVGDLATASAFVNGVMRLAESHRRNLKLGFLSLGRPDAWCRALGIPVDPQRQLDVLCAGNVLPYDAGRVECVDADGAPVTRHFVSGVALWPTMPRAGAPAIETTLTSDGEILHRGTCYAAFAMQSPHYPGLGLVSPQANPSDGALDVAWVEVNGMAALASSLALSLLRVPVGLSHRTAQEVRWSSADPLIGVHADGELIGRLPAVISVMPRTLPVIVEAIGSRLREKQKALMKELGGTALASRYEGLER